MMSQLKELFESFGFVAVETFIASGNVLFESVEGSNVAVETTIASGLQAALGYEVDTFVRSLHELASIVDYEAFPQETLDKAGAFGIAFLSNPLSDEQIGTLMALETDVDSFVSHGREVYWLCSVKQSQSTFSSAVMERKLGIRATFRGVNTLLRVISKGAN
jgi:uncharacterized protein (DUF1697 family)